MVPLTSNYLYAVVQPVLPEGGMLQKDDREGIVHRLLERPVHERKGRTRSLLVPFLSLIGENYDADQR